MSPSFHAWQDIECNALARGVFRAVAPFVLTAVATAQQASRPDPIREYLAACERFGFSGAVCVAKGGRVLLTDGFGLADREKSIRNTKETVFEIASATKPFTAVAIMRLEADGKLSIDDRIARHLPGVPPSFGDVTIRHLLTHTSGMPRSAASGSGDDLEKAVAAYLSSPRVKRAGQAFEYWNGGYALLAGIVERVSGATYMDFCRKRIFEPAGMKSSGFTGESFGDTPVATGYEPDAKPRRADEHPYESYGWQYRGMGGLVTNVEDLFRFDRALRDDTLLPAAARARLFKPFIGSYSLGFEVVEKPRHKVAHGGSVRGFHCQFSRFPKDNACVVVLCNGRIIPPFIIEDTLAALAFGEPPRYPLPPVTVAWDTDRLAAVAGTYEAPSGERVVARIEGGTILLGAEGPEISRELSTSAFGSVPDPGDPALVAAARHLVVRLAAGDVEPLRRRMASHIPARWPDDVKATIWPTRVGTLGRFDSVRVVASVGGHSAKSTRVHLAADFEKGCAKIEVVFTGDRLTRFDLNGPEFFAEAIVAPGADGRLLRYCWQGVQPPPIKVVRDPAGKPAALRFDSAGLTFRRI